MNNFDRRCYKTEVPLSKRLAQELITSPLLGLDGQPKKPTTKGKSPDVNFLFEDEKAKLKTRRTDKLREIINVTSATALNKNEVTRNRQKQKRQSKEHLKYAGPIKATTMSYFVEVADVPEEKQYSPPSYPTVRSSFQSVPTKGDEEVKSVTDKRASSPQRGTTFEKKQSDIPIIDMAKRILLKSPSHVRLQDHELKQLNENQSEKRGSTESSSYAKSATSTSFFKRNLSKFGGPLTRQVSELELNLVGEAVSEHSMDGDNDLSNGAKWSSDCAFPGLEFGQQCHSVAAAIFSKGIQELCISSSSSSEDIFESTKYSREIIEEKLRGRAFEKKEEDDKTREVKLENRKRKVKSKTKSQCKCRNAKDHHGKCSKKLLSKTDRKFIVPGLSREPHVIENESLLHKESSVTISTRDEFVTESVSTMTQTINAKSNESLGKTSDNSSSSEKIVKRPCNVDTCRVLNQWTQPKDPTDSPKPSRPTDDSDHRREEEKLTKEREELSERILSSVRLKSGASTTTESSAFNMIRATAEYCGPGTCELSKNQFQHQKSETPVLMKPSKSEHSWHSSKRSRREICSPKTCKAPRGRSKKRSASKPKKGRFKDRIGSRRWKRKQRHFICNCQNVYAGANDSDTDDLWSDKGMKRCRNRRYNITLENVKKRVGKKCGGFVAEGHTCNCYSCYIKEKPWKRFLKMPNTVLEVPYILTTETLKERALNTNLLSKKLRNKYNWSEENLKNYCTRHEVCKKPNLRRSLLQENPFTWEWKWCHKNKMDRKVRKDISIPKEEKAGRFGYYVNINEERLTRGEHFTNIQKIIEKVVYCKWNQDVAEMKLKHFLENMPKQQSCYSEGKTFDPDRRTCYNPKLIERLGDMVKFSHDPDRRIHEFSFPPKLLKYEEPQLVGGIGTDLPEIRPVYETAKFPTIYRDLFKDKKRDVRKLMDTLLPPLQWTDKAGLWEMKVSTDPDNEETNRNLINYLNYNETLCHAINKNFCAGRYRLYFEVFAEVIRQELINNPERAFLLGRIREEFLLTMLLYDGGLEMTLVSTTHLWKDIEADMTDIIEKETLEREINDIDGQIKSITMAIYDLEKHVEEQNQTRDYQHKDQEKLYKNTNQQLAAQFENIKAGLLYDLD